MKRTKNGRYSLIFPFLGAALLWAAISFGVLLAFSQGGKDLGVDSFLRWYFILWSLSLVDLLSLAKFSSVILDGMSRNKKNGSIILFRAFYWGSLKLACLGIFLFVLMKGRMIPAVSLVMGLSTLIVVPLFGGMLWSQRTADHA